MKKYIPVLRRTQLFAGVGDEEILAMLDCLQVKAHSFRKGEYVFRQGEHIDDICILAEGRLSIQRDDYWGNRSIINMVETGEMFGEAYAAPGSEVMMNDVAAVEDSAVLFFNVKKILTTCSSACRFHSLVVQNLFFAISEKNRKLMRKLTHMSKRTTREKLLSYLSDEAKRQGRSSFEIPFNRQQLADFLSVDRSAMSSELGKMRDEGILTFQKRDTDFSEKPVYPPVRTTCHLPGGMG